MPQRLSTPSRTMPSFSKTLTDAALSTSQTVQTRKTRRWLSAQSTSARAASVAYHLAPFGSGQVIREADLVVLSFLFSTEEVTLSGRVDAHRHKSHEPAIFLALHNPGVRLIAFHRIQQVSEKCLGLLDTLMRTPGEVSGHVGVARVTFINGRCIFHSRYTQAQTRGFKGVWWTKCG